MSVCCFVVGASSSNGSGRGKWQQQQSSSSGFSGRLGRSTSPVSSTRDSCSSTFLLDLLFRSLLFLMLASFFFSLDSILPICFPSSYIYPIMRSLYKLCLAAVGSSNSTLMSLFVPESRESTLRPATFPRCPASPVELPMDHQILTDDLNIIEILKSFDEPLINFRNSFMWKVSKD